MNSLRCLTLTALTAAAVNGAELPVHEGLVLWLEARRQPEARQSAGLPPLASGQHVDAWLDTSPLALRAAQPLALQRPLLVGDAAAALLRFDGKDDFLAVPGPRRVTAALTLFVLAAPKGNAGQFAAFFSAAEAGRNDYESGLNLDQGPAATEELSVLNVESAGAGGFRDLLEPGLLSAAERPFGDVHLFTVRSQPGAGGTELFFDGIKAGARDRLESHLGLEHLLIGARQFSHDPAQPPHARGFFHGDMAAVIVYERALSDEELRAVEAYLLDQRPALHALRQGGAGHALETVKDAPLVQMLAPGFVVEELPLRIGNLNNLRYRHDGKLIALGYDGRIHLLSDTDGDGLEDHSAWYWQEQTLRGPIGMALTPQGDPRGDGVFVASKGKVSFFPDRDGDGRADEEVVVATGWQESFHGVDTVGLAMDGEGALYFGLGCANFADPYLVDQKTGKAGYDLTSVRGTVQRLSADFTTRETICTGVRFTCALAFNRAGDLFATDQEGATWLPNGNAFDELLHIERGRHYGFPPRHPRHLPEVEDEPAVVEYGPQHQSTVGLVFNEGVNGGPAFGPAHWHGDALVCGAARGKLWRAKLVRTPLGYVARNELIACFGMLVVDACVTPRGDLLVACHSGPPDWGTGPTGAGRLFRIRHAKPELPQPVAAWTAGAEEFRVAFDKPLDEAEWLGLAREIRIESGAYASPGDRFEVLRPGYQVVRDQLAQPRRWLDLRGVGFDHGGRTLVLRVPPQGGAGGPASMAHQVVTLPLPASWKTENGLAQAAAMDVAVHAHGVQGRAVLQDGRAAAVLLPHPAPEVSAALMRGSADHEAFMHLARQDGARVTLSGWVDAANPLVPAVQPGSKLDWNPQADPFASAVFAVMNENGRATREKRRWTFLDAVEVPAAAVNGLFLEHEDRRRALPPARLRAPWARPAEMPALAQAGECHDVKGDWLHGRRLFFGEAACFTCHTLRGEGHAFGPDLGNLTQRDRASVWQDLIQPSATLNPDHLGSVITLRDGAQMSGIVRAGAGGTVSLALPGGARMQWPDDQVARIEPLPASLMPEGLMEKLSAREQEDLLTYLLTEPLAPAPLTRADPPPPEPRSLAEIAPLLPPPPDAAQRAQWRPLRLLLSAGGKDHGVDEHDYPLWLERWSRLLALAENVRVETCRDFPAAEQLARADVTVFYSPNGGWDLRAASLLDAYQKRGGGLVYLHFAMEGRRQVKELAERIGLAFSFSAFRHGALELSFTDRTHPITRGFDRLRLLDESYWKMHGDPARLGLLATAVEDHEPRPQLWTLEHQGGRVFGCIPGHYTWTFDDPLYRLLVLRGICWTAGEPDVERLSELSTVGARLRP